MGGGELPKDSDTPPEEKLPEWFVIGKLMLLLHKTEVEIQQGVSPAMMIRLAYIQKVEQAQMEKRNRK